MRLASAAQHGAWLNGSPSSCNVGIQAPSTFCCQWADPASFQPHSGHAGSQRTLLPAPARPGRREAARPCGRPRAGASAQPRRERAAGACARRLPRRMLPVQARGGRAQAMRWRRWAAWATASARRCRRCWRPPRWARCARCAAPTRRPAWPPRRATRGWRAGCSPTYRARPGSAAVPAMLTLRPRVNAVTARRLRSSM